jgi:hypothetical protein
MSKRVLATLRSLPILLVALLVAGASGRHACTRLLSARRGQQPSAVATRARAATSRAETACPSVGLARTAVGMSHGPALHASSSLPAFRPVLSDPAPRAQFITVVLPQYRSRADRSRAPPLL